MTVRDRIWTTLDDPELGRHEGLRNALYQLLVAIEFGRPPPSSSAPSSVERCLDLAADAVRDGSATAVARAGHVIDALVATLAGNTPA
jgi:hypothetical protein